MACSAAATEPATSIFFQPCKLPPHFLELEAQEVENLFAYGHMTGSWESGDLDLIPGALKGALYLQFMQRFC